MEQQQPRIVNRESWLKVGVIATFSTVVAFKVVTSPYNIDFGDLKLSDLVSLVLSIFAIGMSVAFYFKANETSNQFYNNTYKFTKDMSEILGRIEAGFGERLKHLDEGYSGLRDRIDHIPMSSQKAEEAFEKEKIIVAEKEKERHKIIEELAARAKLQDDEKNKLFNDLKQMERALQEARKELSFYRRKTTIADERVDRVPKDAMLNYIKDIVIDALGGSNEVAQLSSNSLKSRFDVIKDNLSPAFVNDCIRAGWATADGLTPIGIKNIRRVALQQLNRISDSEEEKS